MKLNYNKIKYSTIAFLYLFLPQLVFGTNHRSPVDPTEPPTDIGLSNPIKFDSIQALLKAVLDFVVLIGTPIITIAIIWVGFMFVRAQGNSTEIQKAKDALLYVFIGAAIVLGAEALSIVIGNTISNIQGSIQ